MRIVSWNCNGGLRNKLSVLNSLTADVFIIQECEDPSRSTKKYQEWAGEYIWVGESKNKGIGVFPKNGNFVRALNWFKEYTIEGLESNSAYLSWNTSDLRLFLPFRLNNSLTVLGVWTKGTRDQAFGYMGQFWKYLQLHRAELSSTDSIIIGDFNSNSIWDQRDRWWNHTDVVAELESIDKKSLYHYCFKEQQGEETTPTFYLQKNLKKAYHIDYVFASSNYLNSSSCKIANAEDWLKYSDHMPLIINLVE